MDKSYLRSFSLLLSLLIIGATNHCLREDTLASLGKTASGCAPFEQTRHEGSSEGHHQNSHQHLFTGVTTVKAQPDLHTLALSDFSRFFPSALLFERCEQILFKKTRSAFFSVDPPDHFHQAVYSLVSAALAPPVKV